MMRFTSNKLAGLCLAALLPGLSLAQSGAGGTHPVKDILPAETVKELGGVLEPTASINNARATFTLNTAGGPVQVTGTVNMLERVNEERALETLEAMKKTDVYMDAVKNSAKAPVRYGKALWDAPVDTIKDTGRGLGGFFADLGYSVTSDDPNQDNIAKTGLGQSTAKRTFAFELGVNPYSQNEALQAALSEVSWTAVGGGVTVGAAFRAVKNAPGQVLVVSRVANTGRELVRDKSPRQLQNRNEESLANMGVSESLVEAMVNNFNFDPENETRLVVALESMADLEGRPAVVAQASVASSRGQAQELRDWVEMLATYHESVAAAKKVAIIGGAPVLIDEKGRVHGIFPTDYIVPTPDLETTVEKFTRSVKQAGYKPGPLYMTGAIHPQAKKVLSAGGWGPIESHAERVLRGG